jgi:hypothetical protein
MDTDIPPKDIGTERDSDRRKRPTPFLSRYTFVGRRQSARRDDEKHNYYVDRIGARAWAAIAVVLALSIIDSLFTVHLLSKGYREANPIMNTALFIGKPAFIVSKYTLTIIGIITLALHKNFIFVKQLTVVITFLYMCLNIYNVWLYLR